MAELRNVIADLTWNPQAAPDSRRPENPHSPTIVHPLLFGAPKRQLTDSVNHVLFMGAPYARPDRPCCGLNYEGTRR